MEGVVLSLFFYMVKQNQPTDQTSKNKNQILPSPPQQLQIQHITHTTQTHRHTHTQTHTQRNKTYCKAHTQIADFHLHPQRVNQHQNFNPLIVKNINVFNLGIETWD